MWDDSKLLATEICMYLVVSSYRYLKSATIVHIWGINWSTLIWREKSRLILWKSKSRPGGHHCLGVESHVRHHLTKKSVHILFILIESMRDTLALCSGDEKYTASLITQRRARSAQQVPRTMPILKKNLNFAKIFVRKYCLWCLPSDHWSLVVVSEQKIFRQLPRWSLWTEE